MANSNHLSIHSLPDDALAHVFELSLGDRAWDWAWPLPTLVCTQCVHRLRHERAANGRLGFAEATAERALSLIHI